MPSLSACRACAKGTPKLGRPRCPECDHVFRGSGWDGIEAHWRARHLDVMSYPDFWASLCAAHRAAEPLSCPSCRKGVPLSLRQCPECAQVFQGKGWGGIEAHWTSRHEAVMSYPEFWASLCPGHRGDGDPRAGYLLLPPARGRPRRGPKG